MFSSIELRTERLLLRPLRTGDEDGVFAYASDPEVAFFATNRPPMTMDDASAYVERMVRTPWHDRPHFAVTLDDRVIGSAGLEPEWMNMSANLGYEIARPHWGKGYASEAVFAVVDYGFRALGLEKIYAEVDPRNAGSVRVAEKLGMTREGLLRSHLIRRGERVDRLCFGLLYEEWTGSFAGEA